MLAGASSRASTSAAASSGSAGAGRARGASTARTRSRSRAGRRRRRLRGSRAGERATLALTHAHMRAARAAGAGRRRAPSRGRGRVLGRLERAARLRRAVAGRRRPQRARAQAARVLAFRVHRRRPDDVAARAIRRRPQLGLPLRLASRRRLHPARPARARLRRRGAGVLLVADARDADDASRSCGRSTASTAASDCRRGGARRCPATALARRSGSATRQPTQLQLDTYGLAARGRLALLVEDRVARRGSRRRSSPRSRTSSPQLARPDSGIWESRDEPQHYVQSKAMCWTALDRVAPAGGRGRRPGSGPPGGEAAARIREWVEQRGLGRGAPDVPLRARASDDVDASLLTARALRVCRRGRERVSRRPSTRSGASSADGPFLLPLHRRGRDRGRVPHVLVLARRRARAGRPPGRSRRADGRARRGRERRRPLRRGDRPARPASSSATSRRVSSTSRSSTLPSRSPAGTTSRDRRGARGRARRDDRAHDGIAPRAAARLDADGHPAAAGDDLHRRARRATAIGYAIHFTERARLLARLRARSSRRRAGRAGSSGSSRRARTARSPAAAC